MLAADTKRTLTILVVDDSPEMLRYLQFLLELESYRVETAGNGLEALQRLSDGCNPDVVLLDIQMPHLDGFCTLKRLLKVRPDLKVIMCSAVSDPHNIQQATALGAQAYLTKPVRQLYLTAALEGCLGTKAEEKPAAHARRIPLPAPRLQ
jgi:CheY-like chemotaxis protein